MGKRLIIKGADFSQVAVSREIVVREVFGDVDWNAEATNNSNASGTDISGRCVSQWDTGKTAGKKIVAVKLKVKDLESAKLKIGVVRNLMEYIEPNHPKSSFSLEDMPVELQTLTIPSTGIVTVSLPTPIILGENDWIGLGRWDMTDKASTVWLDASKNPLFVNGPENATPYTIVDFSSGSTYSPYFFDLLYEVED